MPFIEESNIKLILVQLSEAHSSAWPKYLEDQPDPQKDFNERISRAKLFMEKYNIASYPSIEVYVDGWDNKLDELLQLWPDSYYLIDNHTIIKKSEYNINGKIFEDYYDIVMQEKK